QAVPSRPILTLEAQELNALTIRRPFAAVSPRRRFTSPPFHLAAVVPAGVSPAAASPAAASGDRLHQLIDVFRAVVIVLHTDAFVAAMGANVVDVYEHTRHAVHRDSRIAQVQTVGRACFHHGNDRNVPESRRHYLE